MAGRPRKTTTKTEPKATAEKVETQEEVKEVEVKTSAPKKRKLNRTDLVPIMNYTTGQLVYESRTGQTWYFTEFGDTDEIELGELVTMKNSQGRILNDGWLLILDDDAVEYLGLSKKYESLLTPDEIDELFNLSDKKIGDVLEKVSPSAKEVIFNKAKLKMEDGSLNSLSKIKLIEDKLKVELIES